MRIMQVHNMHTHPFAVAILDFFMWFHYALAYAIAQAVVQAVA